MKKVSITSLSMRKETGSKVSAQFKKQPKLIKKKRRTRKSSDQFKVLLVHFKRSSQWTSEKMEELSVLTGLKKSQIYKWRWDMQNKTGALKKKKTLTSNGGTGG
jgi:hypothetical protein